MQEILITKLQTYLRRNNPDLLISLQEEGKEHSYLREKVATVDELLSRMLSVGTAPYIIEEQCMELLTRDLRPSKFNYLLAILEDDFVVDYLDFREAGILTYEIINLITACTPIFETFGFSVDNEDDRQLRYAVTGTVQEYLTDKQSRTV